MEIEFVLIADAVEVVNGKLYMLGGGWTEPRSASFPCGIRLGIAISLLVPPEDFRRDFQIGIRIVNSENAEIGPPLRAICRVDPADPQQPIRTTRSFIAVNSGIHVPQPGDYRILVNVGDLPERSVEFRAVMTLQNPVG